MMCVSEVPIVVNGWRVVAGRPKISYHELKGLREDCFDCVLECVAKDGCFELNDVSMTEVLHQKVAFPETVGGSTNC